MSVNDKVKVLWKTNCQWRDRPHWPKRREIYKSRDGDTFQALKKGEMVRIKFDRRWYDAEIAESWTPKTKKGVYINYRFNCSPNYFLFLDFKIM